MKRAGVAMALLAGWAHGEVKLEVNGLRLVGEGYSAKKDAMNAEIRPFNWSKGTAVSLLLTSDDTSIVGLNEDNSKVTVFVDDQGTDLLKAKSKFSSQAYDFGWTTVSEDGKALGTTVETSGIPAKGAKSLTLKGEMVVITGSKIEKEQSGTVAVKEGTKVEVGGYTFELKEVGKPGFGDAKMSVTLKTSQDLEVLKGIAFFDESGEEIESQDTGGSSWGFGGKKTYERSYSLKKKVSEFEIGILKWADLKEVKVPVDLSVGVGM